MSVNVAENVANIKMRIRQACERSGRAVDDVRIIAVTKYVSVATAKQAVEAGIADIGENRIEGALEKAAAIGQARLHFVGSLQSRKVKNIVNVVSCLHSLDRLSLAKEIDKRLEPGKTIDCFVQVNVSGEQSKNGLAPDEVRPFINELAAYPAVRVIGLMTMAPFEQDAERTRPIFSGLRELRDQIQADKLSYAPCTELSMGMSNDFEVAIEEGATFIRLGTSLVGKEES
ncbi:YggS family pyridoxal phosphate-dependent enzyme [Shouchella clausii]|uniref:Pyridoxal phosphate homeostasis protein n=1 Tax=Shouchella clausii TaxID=79880 RepID=A0A268S3H4_SHOCL|nr:YggS family pyridoxal phosphate-dependent enzyme [Shouchella clausii]SPU22079.1 alanine racemase domain-containing protein [Niallia circulans]AST97430.1 YggS family pyridoxal phosphate enzyme [Shouchella clausii]MBU8596525.1 YggS family pyridoxal phosphate-dependent enzyme [Shouchella clausii]MCY1103867.1 YggS family pyridoxal phosphate-dependent enzyme [Shouchella clausii]MEB5472446.1 YggS family pyridoxal phosphate-dependent enzyme [Shouchella clausii]